MNGWRRLAAILIITPLGAACSQPAPVVAAPVPAAAPSIEPSGDWQIRWDRGFAGWTPPVAEGKLSIQRESQRWTAWLRFRQSSSRYAFESMRVDGEQVDIVFRVTDDATRNGPVEVEIRGWVREGRFIGELRRGQSVWMSVGGRRITIPKLLAGAVDHTLPAAPLEASGVDRAALDALLERAREERSNAVVIVKDGKIGVERYREGYDGSPIMAMSASKSMVSMAIGMLIAEGKLTLETTMASLFPEWKALGAKGNITVRQLLSHTSGLEPTRPKWDAESIRERALAAKLVFQPGTRFQYNNLAVDLLAVVFRQASGVSLDAYLETRVFRKLDIVGATWWKDKEGIPRGAGELLIRPVDLAKLGQLMLDGGTWHGERIVPAAWVEESVAAGQTLQDDCGLLWWREGAFGHALTEPVLAGFRDLGLDEEASKALRPLVGRRFAARDEYAAEVQKALGWPTFHKLQDALQRSDHVVFSARVSEGPARGFSARGWLGQRLVVLPKARVVAVRMRQSEASDRNAEGGERDVYPEFGDDVARLFP